MKIILKQDVKGIGRKYEIKEVSDGYANNFLLPKKLAEFASQSAVKKAMVLKSANDAELETKKELLRKQLDSLSETHVLIKSKANSSGHLFAAVHEEDISKALKSQAKIDLPAEFIKFLKINTPIKQTGSHMVKAVVGDMEKEFEVEVEAE
ncbi:MAG TPA: 50S ribosomal protein L9 [Candidatus Paceibacterota bacterium]